MISACIDQANLTACYVAEKLGLTAPYSYETALDVTNKMLMKKKMIENGIPTAKYICVNDATDLRKSELELPVVVKPADSTGSSGVRKANSLFELNKYLSEALKISRSNRAIVEEFKHGVEISIDCFVQNRLAYLLLIRQKYNMTNGVASVMQSPGSMAPADVSQIARKKIQQIANKLANSFDLDNTPLLIQAIIENEDINIIEFSPRVGGGLSYRTIKLITGFDILNSTVNSYLGLHTNLKYKQSESYYSTNIIYAFPGIFGCITGYEDLIEQKIIEEFYYYKTKGMEIGSDMSTRSRAGAFIVKANNRQELFRKSEIAIDRLEVYDIDGNPIMRKDIF